MRAAASARLVEAKEDRLYRGAMAIYRFDNPVVGHELRDLVEAGVFGLDCEDLPDAEEEVEFSIPLEEIVSPASSTHCCSG